MHMFLYVCVLFLFGGGYEVVRGGNDFFNIFSYDLCYYK